MSHVLEFITERRYLKNVTPKTLAWYQHSFKAFEGAMDSKGTIVARIAVLRERGVAAISVNTYLRCINAYLRWLHVEHGQTLLRIPRLKEEHKALVTLSPVQVKRLIQFKPQGRNLSRAHAFALLIMDTGLRRNEALNLAWKDINFESLVLTVMGKGRKERVVPFSLECRKVLFRWKQNHPYELLFGTRNLTHITERNIQRDLHELADKAGITGIRFSPHTLRHSFAVGYLRAGGNLFYLSRILGHTTTRTTERYLQSLGIEDLQAVHSRLSLLTR